MELFLGWCCYVNASYNVILGWEDFMMKTKHTPEVLKALQNFTDFSFEPVRAKEGYNKALAIFCRLKREARAAISKAEGDK